MRGALVEMSVPKKSNLTQFSCFQAELPKQLILDMGFDAAGSGDGLTGEV